MASTSILRVIALVLAVYGVNILLIVAPMFTGNPSPLLVAGFVLQVAAAIASAIGVWRARSWAPGVIVILGLAIVITEVVEGFVLGLIAFNHALLVAVAAMLMSLVLAAWVMKLVGRRAAPTVV